MRDYIGGICALAPADFARLNGFPNDMEGWGGEDDALRDRITVRALAVYTPGSVRNLEEEGTGFVRARNCDAYKMAKEARRRVRAAWAAYSPSCTGLEELLFTATVTAAPAKVPAGVTLYSIDVFGWAAHVSASTGQTYYFNSLTNKSQWLRPASAGVP
jgi:hypothetical protein